MRKILTKVYTDLMELLTGSPNNSEENPYIEYELVAVNGEVVQVFSVLKLEYMMDKKKSLSKEIAKLLGISSRDISLRPDNEYACGGYSDGDFKCTIDLGDKEIQYYLLKIDDEDYDFDM